MTECAWQRFTCGVWTSGGYAAFLPHEWIRCGDVDLEIPKDAVGPFIGIDLGFKKDRTAVVPVWILGGGWVAGRQQVAPNTWKRIWEPSEVPAQVYVGVPTVLEPPGDGSSISVDVIFETCSEYHDRWPNCTFVVDPMAGGEHLAQRLDTSVPGCKVITHSQGTGPMCRASQRLAEVISSERLFHNGDKTLAAHVLACGVRQIGESWRLSKQSGSSSPIDAAIALAMALSTGLDEAGEGSPPPDTPPGAHVAAGF